MADHETNIANICDKNLADETLMFAYAKGDADAFEVLYRRHKDTLYRYFLRQLGNKNTKEALAEELFQETWIKLIKAAKNYKASAKFSTFLYHIAHNTLIDFYRSKDQKAAKQYENQSESFTDEQNYDNLSGNDQDISHLLDIRQQLTFLLQLITLLPEAQREVFLLKEESGLSITQIAEVLSEAEETIKSRYRYAIKKLRGGLDQHNIQYNDSG